MKLRDITKRPLLLKVMLLVLVVFLWILYSLLLKAKTVEGWKYRPTYSVLSTDTIPHIKDGELPYIEDSTEILRSIEGRYTYHYNPKFKTSNWVAYSLTRDEVETKATKRSNKFHTDPAVEAKGWQSANNSDYYRSNYNRGHLVPSSDRDDSREENIATFNFSNIAPQLSRVNSGTWLLIEHKVKEWAYSYGKAYIIAGCISQPPHKVIGKNRVVIPDKFFKAVAVYHNGKWHTTAYIIPNSNDIKDNHKRYQVTIDRLERIVEMDLFYNIESSNTEIIENKKCQNIF